jgi:hypothetical protein
MRPSFIRRITVPTIDDIFRYRNFYPHKIVLNRSTKNKSLYFNYRIDYPAGRVFPDRACCYLYTGRFTDGGLFSPNEFEAKLMVIAYPSADKKEDGYAYIESFGCKNRELSCTDQKVDRIGNAMAKDMQNFIDSEKTSDRYYEGDFKKNTGGTSLIGTNISREAIEEENFFYMRYL